MSESLSEPEDRLLSRASSEEYSFNSSDDFSRSSSPDLGRLGGGDEREVRFWKVRM